jgi:AraC-like DNA-binding protein
MAAMSDLASAAMLRVLHAGMRRLGLPSPAQQWLEQATVPLDAKQRLVMQVMAQRGAAALVQLGQGVHDLQQDTLIPMLIHPGEPTRVLAVWLRLERYLHSKHRIIQTPLSANSVTHQHISIREGTTPNAAEDLVVLGVLIALLERTGCQDVEAELSNGLAIWPLNSSAPQQEALRFAFMQRATHSWHLRWGAVRAMPSAQQNEVQTVNANLLSLSERLKQLASLTQGEALSLGAAAEQLGQSPRSLQRHLRLEGVRYVDVVATARAQRASRMLAEPLPSLAELGFACGYTDQAHFCRDFKRRVGISPLQYRENARL